MLFQKDYKLDHGSNKMLAVVIAGHFFICFTFRGASTADEWDGCDTSFLYTLDGESSLCLTALITDGHILTKLPLEFLCGNGTAVLWLPGSEHSFSSYLKERTLLEQIENSCH